MRAPPVSASDRSRIASTPTGHRQPTEACVGGRPPCDPCSAADSRARVAIGFGRKHWRALVAFEVWLDS